MKIYCDESGYTGVDLLEESQPYFVYSGVNLSDKVANEIKTYIFDNYNIQNSEIKGKNLVNNPQGQAVLTHIFEKYSRFARIVFHDKKFALAAKIVEYGIEPYLTSNYFFYVSKFNCFIAIGLYAALITKDKSAESLFEDFLSLMRGRITFENSSFYSLSQSNPLIEWLVDIMTHDPRLILKEIQSKENQPKKWILDLTMTSLLGILSNWSEAGDELEVICDNSKTFKDNPVLEALNQIGLAGKRADFLGSRLGFKLKEKILNADSKDLIGLQIADLFSSTVFYCLKNQHKQFSKDIMKLVEKNCLCKPDSFCLIPEFNTFKIDFEKNKTLYLSQIYSIYTHVKMK